MIGSSEPSMGRHNGELQTEKLKSHLVRTESLNVLPLKPGVDQYIAIRVTLTARDFFLANFHPSGPFVCISSKTSPEFFLVLDVANTGSCVGQQNKIGHPAYSTGSLVECPLNIKRLQNMCYCFSSFAFRNCG